MTRKDYELLADVLRTERSNIALAPRTTVIQRTQKLDSLDETIRALAVRFQLVNPLFNTQRFCEACGNVNISYTIPKRSK